MPNFLTTREKVKDTLGWTGKARDKRVDAAIASASSGIESETDRYFIPRRESRYFDWPQKNNAPSYEIDLDHDLLHLDTLFIANNNETPVEIDLLDVFLHPGNGIGPYDRLLMNLGTDSRVYAGSNFQNAIKVTGDWSWPYRLRFGGLLKGGVDADDEFLVCSDSARIDVGHTIYVGLEQLFVVEKFPVDTLATVSETLGDSMANVVLKVSDGTKLNQGELILIDGEKMFIESIAGETLAVSRALDGTVLAEHEAWTGIYAYRSLQVERGTNSTTKVLHANLAPISIIQIEGDIEGLALASAIIELQENEAGWVRRVGGGEGSYQASLVDYEKFRARVISKYQRVLHGAVIS